MNAHGYQRSVPAEQEIRYWMRVPVVTINIAAPLSEAIALMEEYSIRHLPAVIDSGEVRGIITYGDIRGADLMRLAGLDLADIGAAMQQIKVYQVMTEHPLIVTPTTGLREAALLMIENKVGGLPVADEAGQLVGIICESDLIEVLLQQLKEA
jgi:CBS domain-containing protein